MIVIGHRVEIRPAYNSETGEQDIWDELAGAAGWVVAHGREGSGEHLVETRDGERHWVYVTRLRDRNSE